MMIPICFLLGSCLWAGLQTIPCFRSLARLVALCIASGGSGHRLLCENVIYTVDFTTCSLVNIILSLLGQGRPAQGNLSLCYPGA